MARSINEIYKEIVAEKDKRLELSEYKSDSKVSVINGIAWFVSAAIYSFETIMDTFVSATCLLISMISSRTGSMELLPTMSMQR